MLKIVLLNRITRLVFTLSKSFLCFIIGISIYDAQNWIVKNFQQWKLTVGNKQSSNIYISNVRLPFNVILEIHNNETNHAQLL